MSGNNDNIAAAPPPAHWSDRFMPAGLRPFARLARWHRPIGWWLLLWPCWWSSVLATDAAGLRYPNLWHIVLFLVGAIAMRGAGCTYNDIVDRDLDGKVARTRLRPIPSGQVTAKQAAIFLVLQALVGLAVLLQFNAFAIAIGVLSLLTVAVYPFMKRFTWWPQVGLGLAFSWGALMGWAAIYGSLGWPPLLLYAGGIAWTIGYDTIYAHQDKEDDALIGIHSTARLFGVNTKPALAVLYTLATLFFAGAWATAGVGLVAWLGLAAGAVQLAWQVRTVDIDDPDNCDRIFHSNSHYGWILFVALIVDGIVRSL